MKRFKITFPVLALILALGASAFTYKPLDSKAPTATLYWFSYNASTNTLGSYIGLMEHDAAKVTGCNQEVGTDCRRAFQSTQLNNPSTPSAGVQSSQISSPADRIKKP